MLTRSTYEAAPDATPAGRRLTSVLVATDGLPDSEAALVLGWAIAGRSGAALRVVSVHQPLPTTGADVAPSAAASDLDRFLGEDLRERVERQLRHAGVAPAEGLLLRRGHPGATIVETAAETGAQLIVLGLRSHGLVQRVLGPETALDVARSSRVPLLAVPARLRWLPQRAVVAVDFSESSARAAQSALDLAGDGGVVMLAHVEPRATIPFAEPSSWRELVPGVLADQFRSFERRLAVPPGIRVEMVTLRGEPGREILALAARAGAELVAAGSHARSAAGRLLLGSVSTAIVRGASCSVLVAPP